MRVVFALMVAVVTIWALPPTQDLKGVVVSAKGLPIAAAVCTLNGVGLPAEGIDVVTNERGQFAFPGLEPGSYNLTCAAVGHWPAIENGIKVTTSSPEPLIVVLPEQRSSTRRSRSMKRPLLSPRSPPRPPAT